MKLKKIMKEQMVWTPGGGENGVEPTFEPEKSPTNKVKEHCGHCGTDKCKCGHPRDSHKFGNSMCRRCDCQQFVDSKSTVDEKVTDNWHCKKCGFVRAKRIWSDATRSSYPLPKPKKCPRCGAVDIDVNENNTTLPIVKKKLSEDEKCSSCNGSGWEIPGEKCDECKGTGFTDPKKVDEADIPKKKCKYCGSFRPSYLIAGHEKECNKNPKKIEGMDDTASGYFMERIHGIFNSALHEGMFSMDTIKSDVDAITKNISAPIVSVKYSALGGKENISILIAISLDEKNTWTNGIFENSKYMRFHLTNDGILEQFTISRIPMKFRKTRVKNVDDAIAKINKYIESLGE